MYATAHIPSRGTHRVSIDICTKTPVSVHSRPLAGEVSRIRFCLPMRYRAVRVSTELRSAGGGVASEEPFSSAALTLGGDPAAAVAAFLDESGNPR